MRVFVLFLFVYLAHAAPQQAGYDYQLQVSPEQFQLLQQYSQQQLQPEPQQHTVVQQPALVAPEAPATNSLTVTDNNGGGYQFANQLVQQAQQLVQYEEQQQQQPKTQTHTEKSRPEVQHIKQQQPIEAQPHHVEPKVVNKDQVLSQPLPAEVVPVETPAPFTNHEQRIQEQYYQPQNVQFNKEFFYLSAPQEDFEQSQDLSRQLDALKRNLRVVFIKAPEQNALANAALQLAKQSADQQTAIYVLTKQHDVNDLAHKLQQVGSAAQSKPEVIFIKYKTQQEAEHAQRTIQSQYEALNGPNHFNHEGVAPTHNFVGSVPFSIDPRYGSTAVSASKPNSKYLPSLKAKL